MCQKCGSSHPVSQSVSRPRARPAAAAFLHRWRHAVSSRQHELVGGYGGIFAVLFFEEIRFPFLAAAEILFLQPYLE